jgi:membrane protein required for colicin V production
MSFIDIVIIILLAGFVWKGVRLGLIEGIGGIIGLFVGVFLAGHYYQQVGEIFKTVLFGSETLATITGFLVVFILVNRLVALIFWIIDKIFNIIAIIPFLKSINRLLGGIFGLIEGLIFIGIIIYVLAFFPLTGGIGRSVENSKFAGIFQTVGKIASPFIPDSIKNVQGFVPNNIDNLIQKVNNTIKK